MHGPQNKMQAGGTFLQSSEKVSLMVLNYKALPFKIYVFLKNIIGVIEIDK